MIAAVLPLIGIPIVLMFYFSYVAGITRQRNSALRESLKDSCAIAILKEMEGSTRAKTYQVVFGKMRQEYERTFVQRMMPVLFDEARKVTLASRSPLAVFYFGLFCLAYGLLSVKVRIHADIEDLRYLVGSELPLLRRGVQVEG